MKRKKTRIENLVLFASLVAISWALSLGATGCGTEVGNGWNPEEQNEEEERSQNPANSTAGTLPGDVDSSASDHMSAPTQELPSDFDAHVLFAACASPFGENLQPYAFYLTLDNAHVITAVPENDQWRLQFGDETVLVTDTAADTSEIIVRDADGEEISSDYSCEDITTDEDVDFNGDAGSYLQKTVTLVKDGNATILSWYLATVSSDLYKIHRIVINYDDTSGTVVESVLEVD